jgi:hypothetical protein
VSAVRKLRFHGRHILQASDAKYHFVPAQVRFTKSFNDSHSITFCTELRPWASLVFWCNHYGPVAREQFLDREFLFILVVFQ